MGTETQPTFREWCVLELMGHRKLAGLVTEQEIAGHGFLRLDIYVQPRPLTQGPQLDTHIATQFYSPSSVYAITPTSEDTARAFAERNQPAPVSRWDLPTLPAVGSAAAVHEEDPEDPPF